MKNIKYLPTVVTAVSFLMLLGLFTLLFLGRTVEELRSDWLVSSWPNFYQHVSNLCISYFLYSAIGYTWLLIGVGLRYIILLGVVILSANLIYESWISILNTRDLIDAYYGFAGTSIGFVFLFLAKRFGLRLNHAAN